MTIFGSKRWMLIFMVVESKPELFETWERSSVSKFCIFSIFGSVWQTFSLKINNASFLPLACMLFAFQAPCHLWCIVHVSINCLQASPCLQIKGLETTQREGRNGTFTKHKHTVQVEPLSAEIYQYFLILQAWLGSLLHFPTPIRAYGMLLPNLDEADKLINL